MVENLKSHQTLIRKSKIKNYQKLPTVKVKGEANTLESYPNHMFLRLDINTLVPII